MSSYSLIRGYAAGLVEPAQPGVRTGGRRSMTAPIWPRATGRHKSGSRRCASGGRSPPPTWARSTRIAECGRGAYLLDGNVLVAVLMAVPMALVVAEQVHQ